MLSGCIGPLYNPYPLSKLSAKVGPPLKLDTMSVEEQINAEIKAESILESNQEEILTTDNTSQSVDQAVQQRQEIKGHTTEPARLCSHS